LPTQFTKYPNPYISAHPRDRGIDIADGGGAVYRLQLSPWRAKPRAMISSIDVSTSGEASPSSTAACNAASWTPRRTG